MRLTKEGVFWHKENPKRTVRIQVFDHPEVGQMVAYSILKFGTKESLAFAPKSRMYYGKITSQTDTEIQFEPMTKGRSVRRCD